ncbi:RNA-directed DNA polymerase, eukaryota [Tanacetum coccineum]
MGVVADLGEHLAPMKRPDKIPNGDWGGFGAGLYISRLTDMDLVFRPAGTKFWLDSWNSDMALCDRFPRIFALETVKEISVADKMEASSLCASFRRTLRFVSRYRYVLDDIYLPALSVETRWVRYVPIKVNVFAWRARLDRLPTRLNLSKRGILTNSIACPICDSAQEDVHHLFFGCTMAKDLSSLICRWWNLPWTAMVSFSDWDAWFLSTRLSSKLKSLLEGVFLTAWWSIWSFRNRLLFDDVPPRRSRIFDDIVSWSHIDGLSSDIRFNLMDNVVQLSGCFFRVHEGMGDTNLTFTPEQYKFFLESCIEEVNRVKAKVEVEDDVNSFNKEGGSSAASEHVNLDAGYDSSFEDGSSKEPNVARGRRKKKSKKDSELGELEETMKNAISSIAAQENQGPTMDECHEKLMSMRLEPDDPIYLVATGIFCQSKSYREAWMLLPSIPNVLKKWIEMMARQLGF